VIAVDRSRLPEPGPDPEFRFPGVVRRALPNGLRVWTVEQRGVPVLSFLFLLSAGSAADPADRPGLAALTADMLDEGSGARSALDIEDALARLGAQFETEVGSDAAVLSVLTLPRFRDDALALLADIVARPRLAGDDFERVRELRLNRLRQLRDLAPAVADRGLARLLYPGQPYGHLPIGTIPSLERTTLDDVRTFHRETWRPSEVTLVAAGDGSHDDLFAAAERAFSDWQPAPAPAATAAGQGDVGTDASHESTRIAIVDRPGAAQSEVRIGQVAVSRLTPDYHALLVLNTVLGGQFVSRLNLNLREEKGYTYGVRSGFEFRRAPGPFVAQAAVQTRVTADAVREMLAEIRDIGGPRPATPQEIELAKFAITRGYPRGFETAGQVARGLVPLALFGLPEDTLERFVPAVHAVTGDEVTAAAQRLDTARMTVAVVGDRAAVEPGLKALGIGEVVVLDSDGPTR
jgi:zinc protease